jgi:spermidine synthase
VSALDDVHPVLPRILLATAPIPGGGELRLVRRGGDFVIMAGTTELMSSRAGGSEAAMAELALARLGGRHAPSLLVGGLGMGFTLRAALARLPASGRIEVAELVPAVIAWAKGPLAQMFGGSLDDPRVSLFEGDVAARIGAASGAYDAVLLDVDNGPDGLSRMGNDGLYGRAGLAAARRALTPGGILAVWSSGPDAAFTGRLADAGFAVETVSARAHGRSGGHRHVIWLARRG